MDFGERGLDLHAVAKPTAGAATPDKDVPDFRFDVGGSWDDLRILRRMCMASSAAPARRRRCSSNSAPVSLFFAHGRSWTAIPIPVVVPRVRPRLRRREAFLRRR